MMIKNLPVICLIFLLSACTGSRYYFNKRIDHSDQENKTESTVLLEKTETAQPVEPISPIVLPETNPVITSQESVVKVEKEEGHKDIPVTEPVIIHENISQKNNPVTVTPKTTTKKSFRSAAYWDIGGWGIFFIVVGAIFLLTVLISLLLGYNIGLALLYGLYAVLIIIILIVWLAFSKGNTGSSNNDDDDNDGDDD